MESCVVLLSILSSVVANTPYLVERSSSSEYFTAALLEHHRVGDQHIHSPDEIVAKNLDFYVRAIEIAKRKGADIIIFPEYGLFPLLPRRTMKDILEEIPDPLDGYYNPCIQHSKFATSVILRTLSCAAQSNELVVVANVGDIQNCTNSTNCPSDGSWHFNANVVLDTNGQIISRYRKEHLFYEPGMDLPSGHQSPIFTTAFGSFAHFVCFDSMFEKIVEFAKRDLSGIILPTEWENMMPFYDSVQFWSAWATGNRATLIVVNQQSPAASAVGSGVFTSNMGSLKYTFNPDGFSKLLVTRVPSNKEQSKPFPNPEADITIITENGTMSYDEDNTDFEHYLPEKCSVNAGKDNYLCFYEKMKNYTFVKLKDTQGHIEVCNNGMCCYLDYEMDRTNETYFLGVLNGTFNSIYHYSWCTENCLVARCDPDSTTACAIFPSKSTTIFQRLDLTANFTTPSVYPSVIKTGMRLASRDEWKYDVKRIFTEPMEVFRGVIQYSKLPDSQSLLMVTLNGRCFNRDPPYVREMTER